MRWVIYNLKFTTLSYKLREREREANRDEISANKNNVAITVLTRNITVYYTRPFFIYLKGLAFNTIFIQVHLHKITPADHFRIQSTAIINYPGQAKYTRVYFLCFTSCSNAR